MDEEKIKKALGGLLKEAKEKRALEDETRKAKNEEDRRAIFDSVGKDIGQVIGPYIDALNARDEASHTAMGDSLKRIITESIKIDAPSVDTSGIQEVLASAFANLKIPEPRVNVTVPEIKVPEIVMPDNIRVTGDVSMPGIGPKTPLHVIMMDQSGKPMMFPVGMSGGGNFPMQVLDAANNALRVSGSFSISASNSSTQAIDSSGNAYNQANPFPVTVVSGGSATTGSALVDSSGVQYSGSNPLPTTASLSVPSGPGEQATALRTLMAGDSVASMNLLQINGSTPATGLNETTAGVLRVTVMTDTAQSANVAMIGGNVPAQGLNETTAGVLRTVLMTDAVASTNLATALDHTIDSISVKQVSGFMDSVYITGVLDSTFIRQARTTNPTAVADGADVRPSADKLGRQLMRMQARELVATAYATLSNGTETTLATAAAGTYIDLVYIMGANTSSVAQQIDIRAGTAGNIVMSLYIPANSTAGVALPMAFPQDATGNAWTADNADVTNSTVYVSALFTKET